MARPVLRKCWSSQVTVPDRGACVKPCGQVAVRAFSLALYHLSLSPFEQWGLLFYTGQ